IYQQCDPNPQHIISKIKIKNMKRKRHDVVWSKGIGFQGLWLLDFTEARSSLFASSCSATKLFISTVPLLLLSRSQHFEIITSNLNSDGVTLSSSSCKHVAPSSAFLRQKCSSGSSMAVIMRIGAYLPFPPSSNVLKVFCDSTLHLITALHIHLPLIMWPRLFLHSPVIPPLTFTCVLRFCEKTNPSGMNDPFCNLLLLPFFCLF
ncbi:unnamed protein product, partial [Vicia faba]